MHKLPISTVEHTVGISTEIEVEAFGLVSIENGCFVRTRNNWSDDTLSPSCRSHTAWFYEQKPSYCYVQLQQKHKTCVYGLPWMTNHVLVDK